MRSIFFFQELIGDTKYFVYVHFGTFDHQSLYLNYLRYDTEQTIHLNILKL